MQEKLIFVISPPRAGSTLLQRMLGAHSEIFTHPEPHLITPLAHLGFYQTVDAAPYDHVNAAEAMRSFVQGLPKGEADYLDALRAYADVLYGRMLATSPKTRFLDKTPAYALVLDELTQIYPHAKYVVLTRHPLAVFSSYANSFYAGDWAEARRFNPVVERYVPAMAAMLRTRPVPLCHVRYETLVARPALELERLFAHLGLENEPEAVNYGKTDMKAGMGDPINVGKHDRPMTRSVEKWAHELSADPAKRALAEDMIARLSDEDLATWGYEREQLWAPLSEGDASKALKPPRNQYTMQRSVMRAVRKQVHNVSGGVELVKRVRYYCDVLLRDQL
ncbi:MAG: sulfotransferase [Myxococcota bacterium]